MVSYFIPRGRFLMKAGYFKQIHQKRQNQQQLQEKWTIFRQLRHGLSSNKSMAANLNNSSQTNSKGTENSRPDDVYRPHAFPKLNENISKGAAIAYRQFYTNQRIFSWSKWARFIMRWAPIGFCFFAAIEWQLHNQNCKLNNAPRVASDFQSKIYRSLPLRLISRCWGWIAALYIPTSLRPYVYGWYSHAFGVNIEEALYPDFKHYKSLAEFFTRPLRDGVRTIDPRAPIVSPADGRVLHFGSAINSSIEQVKGVDYSIESFLGPLTWLDRSNISSSYYSEEIKEKHDGTTTLYQCVIYLAPGDYHRFHSPAEWIPSIRRHFSGELLSVSPRVATWLPGLFTLNERALYLGSWKYGFFSYTAVGATNVGSVEIFIDENLKTNKWMGLNVGAHKNYDEYDEAKLNCSKPCTKGELFGQFNMGSTIVLLFEAPNNFQFNIEAGQKIRVGEPLGFLGED